MLLSLDIVKLELYNFVPLFFFFFVKGIHIQSAGLIDEIRLNIEKLAGNQSNDEEISTSGMSLSKTPILKIWVVKEHLSCVSQFFPNSR